MEIKINKALLGAIGNVDKSEADIAKAMAQGSKAAMDSWNVIKKVCEIDDSQLHYLKDPAGEDKKNNHWVSTRNIWAQHVYAALMGERSVGYMYDKNVVGADEITAEGGRQKGKRKTKRTWQQDMGKISGRSIGYINAVLNPETKKRDGVKSTHIDLLHKGLKSVLTQVNKKKPDGTIKDPVIEKLKGKSTQDLFNLLTK
tara:strand:+ start:21 stop:620 length:600 start_codon:yes stop_codon:yes gene_type:complete